MNNEVIYRGLKLTSTVCRYYQVKEGCSFTMVEDPNTSCLTITYPKGSTAKSLSVTLGLQTVGDTSKEMEPMFLPAKFPSVVFSLNGLKFKKLTADNHVINVVIVGDSESRVVQSYGRTVIVVNVKDYNDPEFLNFLFFSGNLLYIKPQGPLPKGYELRNFPRLIIKNNAEYTSRSVTVFNLRKRYDDYLIRAIDYQDQVILELRRILTDYGVELVRFNKETSLAKTSYVTYQFTQTPVNFLHPRYSDVEREIMSHSQPIEFVLHTKDMILFHDFKNKYKNVNLLTNFTEFKTSDRYGDRWTAAIKWGPVSDEFNHNYAQDDNSNFAFQCQFTCEIYFYEVLDSKYEFLKEITYALDSEDRDRQNKVEEKKSITQ